MLDRSVLEVFINGGSQSATMLYFAEEPLGVLSVGMSGAAAGITADVMVSALTSAWVEMEGEDGMVTGNVTGHNGSLRAERRHVRVAYEAEFE